MDIRLAATFLAIVNTATANMGVHVSVQVPAFSSLGCISRSGIAGSYGHFIFNVLKKFHAVFSVVALFYISASNEENRNFSPHKHLLFLGFCYCFCFTAAILMDMKWFCIVFWICISVILVMLSIFSCAHQPFVYLYIQVLCL